jgi:hypothetical protein
MNYPMASANFIDLPTEQKAGLKYLRGNRQGGFHGPQTTFLPQNGTGRRGGCNSRFKIFTVC